MTDIHSYSDHVPTNTILPDASDKDVLDLVRSWVEILAAQRYQIVFDKLGYALAYGEPGADCIRRAIQNYRSPDYYPGIDNFSVSNWRTARGRGSARVSWPKLRSAPASFPPGVRIHTPVNGLPQ